MTEDEATVPEWLTPEGRENWARMSDAERVQVLLIRDQNEERKKEVERLTNELASMEGAGPAEFENSQVLRYIWAKMIPAERAEYLRHAQEWKDLPGDVQYRLGESWGNEMIGRIAAREQSGSGAGRTFLGFLVLGVIVGLALFLMR